jgi:succinoglycan biosynthesis protein ExoM
MTAPRIAIGICTYQRANGLIALLAAVEQLRFDTLLAADIAVIVVDNSSNRFAEEICRRHGQTSRFPMHWISEPRRGLTYARNAAISTAIGVKATHLAFIDDDEMPAPDWIDQLYRRLKETGAAAAVGPVIPLFETSPSRWVPIPAYCTAPAIDGGFALEGYTCNAIIDLGILSRAGLAFDVRFNETGGEDTHLFKALRASGQVIAWAPSAAVFESVPKTRMRAPWLLRRWFRTGTVEAVIGTPNREAPSRTVNIVKGLSRLAYGSGRIVTALMLQSWRHPHALVASCFTFCRGAGFLASVLGRSYKEYAQPNYR